jgi:hypothetical protein
VSQDYESSSGENTLREYVMSEIVQRVDSLEGSFTTIESEVNSLDGETTDSWSKLRLWLRVDADNGLTIGKSDARTIGQMTADGFFVRQGDASGLVLLAATAEGVDADRFNAASSVAIGTGAKRWIWQRSQDGLRLDHIYG